MQLNVSQVTMETIVVRNV
jgi:hypothetical protein